MFGSEVLEVAIGLLTVYILLSLFCTTLTELIARMAALRSSTLEQGIRNLLTDVNEKDGRAIADEFFQHPLISGLGLKGKGQVSVSENNPDDKEPVSKPGKKGSPSYMTSSYFALALYDTLFPEDAAQGAKSLEQVRAAIDGLDPQLKQPLLALLAEADYDLKKFRKNMEGWFDELMGRVNGWYSRKAKLISLIIAVIITAVFNADTLMMANTLSRNATIRGALVATAGQLDADEEKPAQDLVDLQSELLGTGLLGWLDTSADYDDAREHPTTAGGWGFKAAGLVLTAILVSLGAPFWFDILNKVSNLRATGSPPENGQENGKKKNEIVLKIDTNGAQQQPAGETSDT